MLEDIFQIIISPELQRALLPLKILLVSVAFLAIVLIIYFLSVTPYLRYRFFERWEDHLHWRRLYSLRAKKKARRVSSSGLTAPSDKPLPPFSSDSSVVSDVAPREEGVFEEEGKEEATKEIDLKNGRIERSDWERILDKLESGNELNYKLAFIDVDKLFDRTLEEKGKKLSEEAISNAEDILKAKEVLRKMLAHPKATLSLERAKELIGIYQKAFSELKAI